MLINPTAKPAASRPGECGYLLVSKVVNVRDAVVDSLVQLHQLFRGEVNGGGRFGDLDELWRQVVEDLRRSARVGRGDFRESA